MMAQIMQLGIVSGGLGIFFYYFISRNKSA